MDGHPAGTAGSHLLLPPSAWPRGKVYCFCPRCTTVHAVDAAAQAACPACGRHPLHDIFAEMASRLKRAFGFFDATRSAGHPWLFTTAPGEEAHALFISSMALGAFGELRSLGFTPPSHAPWDSDGAVLAAWTDAVLEHLDPATNLLRVPEGDGTIGGAVASPERYVSSGFEWQLHNRVFMADRYRLPAGAQSNRDYLATVEEARGWLEATWAAHAPWTAGSWTTRAVETHLALQDDPAVVDFVRQWLEARQDQVTGAWYAGVEASHSNVVNGIFKLFVTYERLGWEIPRQRAIVDFVLGGADRKRGFGGQGCSVFDPMQVLYVLRCRGNGYRAEEVDAATAASFLTFLDNWDEAAGWFREGTWHGKHNLGIPLYMASLLLDHPYMRINTIYNWREGPIILRSPDGSVGVRPGIIHHTRGHPFTG